MPANGRGGSLISGFYGKCHRKCTARVFVGQVVNLRPIVSRPFPGFRGKQVNNLPHFAGKGEKVR